MKKEVKRALEEMKINELRRVGNELTGERFTRLTVLGEALEKDNRGNVRWICRCSCGNFLKANGNNLRSGHTQSCGCLRKEIASELKANTKHGLSHDKNGKITKLYAIWTTMKQRCHNSNTKQYKYYGARGIKVCDEWKNDYMNFYNWAMKNGYREGLTIDRIDVNGNYEPDNCEWVTKSENTRRMHESKKNKSI